MEKNMRKRMFILAAAAGLCLSAAPVTALAADDIDEVYISLVTEDSIDNMNPGDTLWGTEPETPDSDEYWISDSSYSGSEEPGKSGTCTIEVRCGTESRFTSRTEIRVYGAYEVSVSSRSGRRMTIKARTYPFHVLSAVSGISIDEGAKKVSWDKVEHARGYSVKIYYTDKNGRERSTKKTANSTSLSLSGYLDKYTDVKVSVKANRGSGTGDRFIAESGYFLEGGTKDPEEETEENDFRVPTAVRNGTGDDDGGGSRPGGSGGPAGGPVPPPPGSSGGPGYAGGASPSPGGAGTSAGYTGWQGSGDNWYYLIGGVRASGWVQPTAGEWYLLGGNGLMLAGWQRVGGLYYYLNEKHDGTYGKMLAGLQNIGGKTYYLNEQHDGTYGAMYASRYIPDGRYAGADGAVIPR